MTNFDFLADVLVDDNFIASDEWQERQEILAELAEEQENERE